MHWFTNCFRTKGHPVSPWATSAYSSRIQLTVQLHQDITRTRQQLCLRSHQHASATSLSPRKEVSHHFSWFFSHSTIKYLSPCTYSASIFHLFSCVNLPAACCFSPVKTWCNPSFPLSKLPSLLHSSVPVEGGGGGGNILVPSGLWCVWVVRNGILQHPFSVPVCIRTHSCLLFFFKIIFSFPHPPHH